MDIQLTIPNTQLEGRDPDKQETHSQTSPPQCPSQLARPVSARLGSPFCIGEVSPNSFDEGLIDPKDNFDKIVDVSITLVPPIEIFDHWDTLVIAGGSMKGISVLGAVQWLVDQNYLYGVKNYIGTSVGTLICYLVMIGYTPIEVIANICSRKITEKLTCLDINSGLSGKGAVSFNPIQEELEKMTLEKLGTLLTMKESYNRFGKKLICTVYNLTKNKTEYISVDTHPDIPCITAIRMSCSLPLIFEEVKYLDSYYVDGGLVDNFPFKYAKSVGKYIIGIDIKSERNAKPLFQTNMFEYLYQFMCISISSNNEKEHKVDSRLHKIINIETNAIKVFNFNISTRDKLDLFSLGYNQISQQF